MGRPQRLLCFFACACIGFCVLDRCFLFLVVSWIIIILLPFGLFEFVIYRFEYTCRYICDMML